MTIDQAIRELQEARERGVRSIIFAYWEAQMFGLDDNRDWEAAAEQAEGGMDWSSTHENLSEIISDA
jgi:hypothetical protein